MNEYNGKVKVGKNKNKWHKCTNAKYLQTK